MASEVFLASEAETIDLAVLLGRMGEMIKPETIKAIICPKKVGGIIFMNNKATLFSNPDSEAAMEIPKAPNTNQYVVLVYAAKAVAKGTVFVNTITTHIVKRARYSGIIPIMIQNIATTRRPMPITDSCERGSLTGMNKQITGIIIPIIIPTSFFVDIFISLSFPFSFNIPLVTSLLGVDSTKKT
jgi:hypothetical protein